MSKIKTALISVNDKSNLKIVLKELKKYKIQIVSSGGTFKNIKKLGFNCMEVSDYTNYPELLDGRVKTLHPKIHAGILSKAQNINHKKQLKESGFEEIDLIIVNFYPFERTIKKTKNYNKIIDNIDIGGPTMVRAAAKNHERVTVITSINQYESLISELNKNNGGTSFKFRKIMAENAFIETGYYDSVIANYFSNLSNNKFPKKKVIYGKKVEDLRYGENPHQKSSVYSYYGRNTEINQLAGKKLGYNNYNDLYSALTLSNSLPKNTGTVIVKHANPCGVSSVKDKLKSFQLAYACDPKSAFGGIVSCNFKIQKKLAAQLNKTFFEIVIGKGFENEALKILKKKKNLRIIDSKNFKIQDTQEIKSNLNNLFIQDLDAKIFSKKDFKVVSKIKPGKKVLENLIFAFNVCRYTKSNAIVLTKNFSTVGIGSGQPSRIDSCQISIEKMNRILDLRLFSKNNDKELYAASDAFFPFTDNLEKLAIAGVTAIIQPSGSIRDKEIIKFADKIGLTLVFSKKRYFKH